MARVSDILLALEEIAPRRFTFEFDRVGLQVGDPNAEVTRAVLALDRSLGAIAHCKGQGAELLLTHHPLIFQPIQSVTANSDPGRAILELAANRINFIAAHTNWDSAIGGINDALCEILELQDVKPFGHAAGVKQFRLIVTTPAEHSVRLIDALSAAGAGQIGRYSQCSFRSPGIGTFQPGDGASPTLGVVGEFSAAEEEQLEMVVREDLVKAVERALQRVHPYETPAYTFSVLKDQREQPAGRIGKLLTPMKLGEFVQQLDQRLSTASLVWGNADKLIKSVAVVGGGADGEWIAAQRAGADVFVTGEVKQHIALAACEGGLAITSSGHYATEQPGVFSLAKRLAVAVPNVKWEVYEPSPGEFGRPL